MLLHCVDSRLTASEVVNNHASFDIFLYFLSYYFICECIFLLKVLHYVAMEFCAYPDVGK